METLAVPFLLVVGGLLAVQAAANVRIGVAMGSSVGASTLQLGIAAVLLLALAAAAGSLGALDLLASVQPWHLSGGLGSALYITAGILLFPRLGAVVAVGLFIAGQMLASLALDGLGLLGVAIEKPGPPELAGAAAVIAGTVLIVVAQAGGETLARVARGRWPWLGLGLLAGAALPVQAAINAQLQIDLDAPLAVAATSFLVATVAMALMLAAWLAATSAPRPAVRPLRGLPWWAWLGGFIGATYVTSTFMLIPEIGAAPTIALTVAGQQLASALVDEFGLLGLRQRRITRLRGAAAALLLAGVALIQLT